MHFDEGTDDLLGPILKTSALPIFLLHILLSVAYASWVREKRADASGRSLKAASCSSEHNFDVVRLKDGIRRVILTPSLGALASWRSSPSGPDLPP